MWKTSIAASVLAFTLAMPVARAWDDFGHMEVAAVAWARMNAKTRKEAARLLALNPRHADWIVGAPPADRDRVAFLRAGTWADAIRHDAAYTDDERSSPTGARDVGYADHRKHRPWHYADRPHSPDGTPLGELESPNAGTEIPLLRAELAAPATSDEVKSYALTWLLHLVADIHNPLHCISRYDRGLPKGDRGGNLIKIVGNAQPDPCDDPRYCPYGPPAQLHAFLDTIAGSGYAWAPAEAAARRLPRPDPARARILDVATWIDEGFELARREVYVPPIGAGAGPFTITPAYQAAMLRLGRERIALAGARLAALLDDALGSAREAHGQ